MPRADIWTRDQLLLTATRSGRGPWLTALAAISAIIWLLTVAHWATASTSRRYVRMLHGRGDVIIVQDGFLFEQVPSPGDVVSVMIYDDGRVVNVAGFYYITTRDFRVFLIPYWFVLTLA